MLRLDAYCTTKDGVEVGGGLIVEGIVSEVAAEVIKRITDALNNRSNITINFDPDPYYKGCVSNMSVGVVPTKENDTDFRI